MAHHTLAGWIWHTYVCQSRVDPDVSLIIISFLLDTVLASLLHPPCGFDSFHPSFLRICSIFLTSLHFRSGYPTLPSVARLLTSVRRLSSTNARERHLYAGRRVRMPSIPSFPFIITTPSTDTKPQHSDGLSGSPASPSSSRIGPLRDRCQRGVSRGNVLPYVPTPEVIYQIRDSHWTPVEAAGF